MDSKTRQKALDEISPDDLEKIKSHQASTKGSLPVDNEWLLLTEFALLFGWQAYKDARNDEISLEHMLTLISASRKIRNRNIFEAAQANFIGSISSKTKNPVNTFRTITKQLINLTKADE